MEYKCTSDETLVTTTSIVLTKLSNVIDHSASNEPELSQENKTLELFSIEKMSRKIVQLNMALINNNEVANKTTCFSPKNLWKNPQTIAPRKGDNIINSNKDYPFIELASSTKIELLNL